MPILDPHSLEFLSRGPDQTRRAGIRLGSLLEPGDLVCLIGELGAGKTTLVQGINNGWGSLDRTSSPTFVLVNVYRRPDGQRLYHVDAYRISDSLEAEDLDLDSMLRNGPMVVEWAERIDKALPKEHLTVHLRHIDRDQRDLLITARGERYQNMLKDFRKIVYGVS